MYRLSSIQNHPAIFMGLLGNHYQQNCFILVVLSKDFLTSSTAIKLFSYSFSLCSDK